MTPDPKTKTWISGGKTRSITWQPDTGEDEDQFCNRVDEEFAEILELFPED